MRTAIIGLGVTGLSCLRHLYDTDELVVVDTRITPPNAEEVATRYPDAEYRFGSCQFDFSLAERVIVSPGVSLETPLVRSAVGAGLPVMSDIDLFCHEVSVPIFAVTGTNGKSTVTSLVGHLLEQLGRSPGVGGNLGDAALDIIAADRDCYAIELSSFQLERMQSHRFQTATILNISEDHIDRHGSLQRYAAAKQRIYNRARRAVANRDDAMTQPQGHVDQLVTFGTDTPSPGAWGIRTDARRCLALGDENVIGVDELPLAGRHNEQNVLAAFAMLCEREDGSDGEATPSALANAVHGFRGLAHRCERVTCWREVEFVNDSKATNVGATLAALEGLSDNRRSIVLIAGGDGKGADFAPLKRAINGWVRHLVLLGVDAPALQAAVGDDVPVSHVENMGEAVVAACDAAQPGDTVLLSPACASLDMYDSYVQRGDAFRDAVLGLGT